MDAEGTGERPGLVGCYPPLHPGQPSTAPQRIVTSCPISAALLGQALFLATWRNSPRAWILPVHDWPHPPGTECDVCEDDSLPPLPLLNPNLFLPECSL